MSASARLRRWLAPHTHPTHQVLSGRCSRRCRRGTGPWILLVVRVVGDRVDTRHEEPGANDVAQGHGDDVLQHHVGECNGRAVQHALCAVISACARARKPKCTPHAGVSTAGERLACSAWWDRCATIALTWAMRAPRAWAHAHLWEEEHVRHAVLEPHGHKCRHGQQDCQDLRGARARVHWRA